jgi:hypothetical protein
MKLILPSDWPRIEGKPLKSITFFSRSQASPDNGILCPWTGR